MDFPHEFEFDLSEFDDEELQALQADISFEISKRKSLDHPPELDFYSRVLLLQEQLEPLQGRKLAINIDGEDCDIRLEFRDGVRFILDVFPGSALNIAAYNSEEYDQLYFEDCSLDSKIHHIYLPLYCDFVASPDKNILNDEDDDEFADEDTLKNWDEDILEHENVVFVIKMDTLDCVITDDLED